MENIDLHHNIAYANRYSGITIAGWGEEGAAHPMQNLILTNNTLYNNGTGTWGGAICFENPEATDIDVRNNICSDNQYFQIAIEEPAQNLTVAYNLIDGFRDYENEIYGDNYVEGDPLFISISEPDFHLQATSPAIDSGDPSSPYDPDGTIIDMGAYYYDQSSALSPPENVIITIIGDSVQIIWNPVSGASLYNVYSSINPFSGFAPEESGITNCFWNEPISDTVKFYYITAE